MFTDRVEKLDQLSSAELDAGAHGGSGDAALDILTLGSGGLSLDDSAQEAGEDSSRQDSC